MRLEPIATRNELRAAGTTDRQIFTRLRRGKLIVLRRGILAPPGLERLDADAAATVLALRRDLAVSHAHAARLWGLPMPVGGWPPLSVTATSGPTRLRDDMHVLVAPCTDDEVTTGPGGMPVTTLPRTISDCLRTLRPHDGLAIADAAQRLHGLSSTDLDSALRRQRGWPGVVRARRVAALMDGRRETPLEAWSAWVFHDLGVTAPAWQVEIFSASGLFVARTDCWWPGVVGEADGRAKYLLAAAERGGADADALARVLHQERERELDLRRLGAEIVRWGPPDVLNGRRAIELATSVNRVLATAERTARFTGSAHSSPPMLRG